MCGYIYIICMYCMYVCMYVCNCHHLLQLSTLLGEGRNSLLGADFISHT